MKPHPVSSGLLISRFLIFPPHGPGPTSLLFLKHAHLLPPEERSFFPSVSRTPAVHQNLLSRTEALQSSAKQRGETVLTYENPAKESRAIQNVITRTTMAKRFKIKAAKGQVCEAKPRRTARKYKFPTVLS